MGFVRGRRKFLAIIPKKTITRISSIVISKIYEKVMSKVYIKFHNF